MVVRLDKLSRQRRESLARQLLTTSGSRTAAAGAAASAGVLSAVTFIIVCADTFTSSLAFTVGHCCTTCNKGTRAPQ